VKNRFQNLPFKCNLQRYNAAAGKLRSLRPQPKVPAANLLRATLSVGLYTLNPVQLSTRSLQTPGGFNPCAT
jgi:hypothetical protein